MPDQAKQLETLIGSVRATFGRLRAVGDVLHADIGVTAAMRAVMEFLDKKGTATVPDIARAKLTSRQNIQILVDALSRVGLVRLTENPAHKRSSLVALSAEGRATFKAMRRRERVLLLRLAKGIKPGAIAETLSTLNALTAGLDAELGKAMERTRDDND